MKPESSLFVDYRIRVWIERAGDLDRIAQRTWKFLGDPQPLTVPLPEFINQSCAMPTSRGALV